MTKEEREAKREAKKQERAAKRAAILEQKKAKAEAKKLKREEKKAKRLARLEKQKAKKAAIRQKKREAREAKRAKELAKKLALKEKKLALKNAKMLSKKQQKKTIVNDGSVDIRDAAKMMKKALKQIAAEFAGYDSKKLDKKSKAIVGLGYEVNVEDGNVIVNFNASKSKKILAFEQPKENDVIVPEVDDLIDDNIDDEDQPKEKVEMVPAGDLYATDGEVANIDVDDEANLDDDEDDAENDNDNSMIDYRDETDEDLVDARREFFGNFGDDGSGYDD